MPSSPGQHTAQQPPPRSSKDRSVGAAGDTGVLLGATPSSKETGGNAGFSTADALLCHVTTKALFGYFSYLRSVKAVALFRLQRFSLPGQPCTSVEPHAVQETYLNSVPWQETQTTLIGSYWYVKCFPLCSLWCVVLRHKFHSTHLK